MAPAPITDWCDKTELQRGCRQQNIDYVQLRTDTNLAVALYQKRL